MQRGDRVIRQIDQSEQPTFQSAEARSSDVPRMEHPNGGSMNVLLRFVSITEVLAGSVGLASTVRVVGLTDGGGIRFEIWLTLLSALGILIGVSLWFGPNRWWRLSFIWQALQTVQFSTGSVIFRLMIGLECGINIKWPYMRLVWQSGAAFSLFFPYSDSSTTLIFLNVVPLVVLILLLRGRRRQAAVERATTRSKRQWR